MELIGCFADYSGVQYEKNPVLESVFSANQLLINSYPEGVYLASFVYVKFDGK